MWVLSGNFPPLPQSFTPCQVNLLVCQGVNWNGDCSKKKPPTILKNIERFHSTNECCMLFLTLKEIVEDFGQRDIKYINTCWLCPHAKIQGIHVPTDAGSECRTSTCPIGVHCIWSWWKVTELESYWTAVCSRQIKLWLTSTPCIKVSGVVQSMFTYI